MAYPRPVIHYLHSPTFYPFIEKDVYKFWSTVPKKKNKIKYWKTNIYLQRFRN